MSILKKLNILFVIIFVFFLSSFAFMGMARAGEKSCSSDGDCWGVGGICKDGKCWDSRGKCVNPLDCDDRECARPTPTTPSFCIGVGETAPLSTPAGEECTQAIECAGDLGCPSATGTENVCGPCTGDDDCEGKGNSTCSDGRCQGMTCADDANCATYGAGYTCDQEQSVCIFTPPQTAEVSGREVPGPSLQIPIPGILTNFSPAPLLGEPGERYFYFPWIGQYIAAVYQYILGIVGILATVVIVWAGVLWLTAAGNAEKIKLAKEYIAGALIGLVLAFGSYLILYLLNPDLVSFEALKLKMVERVLMADEPYYADYDGLLGDIGDLKEKNCEPADPAVVQNILNYSDLVFNTVYPFGKAIKDNTALSVEERNNQIMNLRLTGGVPGQVLAARFNQLYARISSNMLFRHCFATAETIYVMADAHAVKIAAVSIPEFFKKYLFLRRSIYPNIKEVTDPEKSQELTRQDLARIEMWKMISSALVSGGKQKFEDIIQPGDWIWLFNANYPSTYGNHSAIFTGWANKERGIAKFFQNSTSTAVSKVSLCIAPDEDGKCGNLVVAPIIAVWRHNPVCTE